MRRGCRKGKPSRAEREGGIDWEWLKNHAIVSTVKLDFVLFMLDF